MIKSIETKYNGYKFRSRLEARWDYYFDLMEIKYEHEPEGFDFENGSPFYIPDFYLPQVSMWAEVKPFEFDEDEINKVKNLVKGTKKPCLLLVGTPDIRVYQAVEIGEHYYQDEPKEDFVTQSYAVCMDSHRYPETEKRFYSMPGSDEGEDLMIEVGCYKYPNIIEKVREFRFEFNK